MPNKKICSRRKLTRRELSDLDIEIGFLQALVERDPTYYEALQLLGLDYSLRGDFANGLRTDQCLAQLRPSDPVVLYNLACSYSLNRQLRQAADTLNQAIEQGYDNFHLLAKDPDLANLRKHPVYKRVRQKIHSVSSKLVP